jgi:7-cyano-7-deazaguanine synthase
LTSSFSSLRSLPPAIGEGRLFARPRSAHMGPMNETSGALLLFSGGQDSAVCLAWALQRYGRVETVGFDYGQRHSVELQARQAVREAIAAGYPQWRERLGPDHVLDMRGFGAVAESALTADRAIELTEKGLPSTFVPGRNLAFFVYAAALADRRGLKRLVGGMCETDFSGYPDCRRDSLDAMERALSLGMAQDFVIETPLMRLTKAETWALARRLGGEALVELIVRDSHTCYLGERGELHAWGYGCGTCPACELRARGWEQWVAEGRPALAAEGLPA